MELSDDAREVLALFGHAQNPNAVPTLGGADARLWRVDGWGPPCALRLLGPDQAIQAEIEQAAMARAHRAGLPVPRVLETRVWRGHPALLLDWMPGAPLADIKAGAGDLSAVTALGERFGTVLAAIHRVAAPPGLPTDWPNWPRAKPELAAHLRTVELRPPVLLHLDFHPRNVLVDGGTITAVLDWANAHAGDPRADLARTLGILEFTPLPAQLDPIRAAALRRAFVRAWRRGYCAAGGSFAGLAPFCWGAGGSFAGLAPFCWGAGEAMEQDLARREFGRPPWFTPDFLHRVRDWTAAWRRRALKRAKGAD